MAQIAILGTGRMGLGLGTGWAKTGHTIVFGSQNPESKGDIAANIKGAKITGLSQALDGADVVVIGIPFLAVEPFAREQASVLRTKLVIDISNPFNELPDNRISAAEITAAAIGEGARVVAAFKTNFWTTLSQPVNENGVVRDVQIAGDSSADKKIVSQLIEDLGFRPIDCGALKNARVLDGMVSLIIELDTRYGGAQKSSIKLIT